MRSWTIMLFLIVPAFASGQSLKLIYSETGLGSNRWSSPDIEILINDSLLTYFIYENSSRYTINEVSKDTNWEKQKNAYQVYFRESSKDSILHFLKGSEGKSVYNSNPSIMSGGIQHLYIETEDWCTDFSLKNTFDSTALRIVTLINQYLPSNKNIYIPFDLWKDRSDQGLIRTCPGTGDKTYKEILMDDYELIRKKTKKKPVE